MTGVCTAALLPTKPSLDDDSQFRQGFRAEASLPLTQSVLAITYDTTRLLDFCLSIGLLYLR